MVSLLRALQTAEILVSTGVLRANLRTGCEGEERQRYESNSSNEGQKLCSCCRRKMSVQLQVKLDIKQQDSTQQKRVWAAFWGAGRAYYNHLSSTELLLRIHPHHRLPESNCTAWKAHSQGTFLSADAQGTVCSTNCWGKPSGSEPHLGRSEILYCHTSQAHAPSHYLASSKAYRCQ